MALRIACCRHPGAGPIPDGRGQLAQALDPAVPGHEKALQDQVREKKNIVLKMNCVPEAFLSEDGTLTGLTILRKTDGAQENLPVSAVFVAAYIGAIALIGADALRHGAGFWRIFGRYMLFMYGYKIFDILV